jgi:hypothetical protein
VYYGSSVLPPTVIVNTTTVTSIATVIQLVTSISTRPSDPSLVTLNGTVQSAGDLPVAVDFCSLTRQSLINVDNTSVGNEITGISCGAYSSPVRVTNKTLETSGYGNYTNFLGTYSTKLPNNATYLLQVRLMLASGANFEEEAGWLPLNYTTSSHIIDFGIVCFNLANNGSSSYQCNSGFN